MSATPSTRPQTPAAGFGSTSSSSPIPPEDGTPTRHTVYYFQDELITFQVEHHFFKIHRYFLARESEFFQTMFQLPRRDEDMEGQTDDTAILLPDVTCQEFESLLDFLYNGMHDDYKPDLSQWVNILSISTRFICDKVRERAILEIDRHRPRIDPVEKIVLANKHSIPKWLTPSYEAICQRAHPLEIAEAEKLGLVTTVLLARAREAVRQEFDPSRPSPVSISTRILVPPEEVLRYNSGRVSAIVQEVFWPPLSPPPSPSPAPSFHEWGEVLGE
ncbi:hypothetical protein AcV5_009643 [Taiwanofungus camphoratus]|nr:hypothetical protein AcV5_009643 [Antrodia cinnamomea]